MRDEYNVIDGDPIEEDSTVEDLGVEPPPHCDPLSMHGGAPPEELPAEQPSGAEGPGPVVERPEAFHRPRVRLTIEGLEATQGTQFYRSSRQLPLGQAEPDNSIPLIDRKQLAIRVYPDLRITTFFLPSTATFTVDGDVWFKRIDVPDTYKRALRLNGPVAGRRATAIDRGNRNHTLNYRISDLYTRGRIVVYARVWADVFGRRYVSPWFGRIFRFVTVPAVRIRAHGVRYQRGTISRPAPTLADFLATGVYLRKTYPMSRFNFVSYDVINFGGDLTDTSGGGCGTGWNALWQQLRNLFFATGQDANHYALMETGIPTAYGGCGGGNVGASFVGGGSVMAQELGHGLGRGHAPGCGAGGPDPNYPQYDGYNSASIGEFGMDYATGAVYDPANSNDFMGYCGNPWVSPYTYRALITGIQNQPTPGPAPAAAAHAESLSHQEEHLYLSFRVGCEGDVELRSGFTMVGPPARPQGKESHYSVEVQDAEGAILYAKRLTLEEAHQDHSHSHTEYFDAFPLHKGAAKLVFKCGHAAGPTIFEIPKTPPTVKVKLPKGIGKEALSGTITLDWTGDAAAGENLSYMVRYSNDDGESWHPVAIGLDDTSYKVDLDRLPGGRACKLQLVASTILRTATAETASFAVLKKPRTAMISPVPDPLGTRPSRHVELAGCAYSPDGCCVEEGLMWFSSLQGYLGSGSHLIANNLIPGEHVITLVAPDGIDGETRTDYRVRVLPDDLLPKN